MLQQMTTDLVLPIASTAAARAGKARHCVPQLGPLREQGLTPRVGSAAAPWELCAVKIHCQVLGSHSPLEQQDEVLVLSLGVP